MPLGTCFSPEISPMMSGMAASCSQPLGAGFDHFGREPQRSTIGSASPAARARFRSSALSARSGSTLAQQAGQRQQSFVLVAADALATSAEALFGLQTQGLHEFNGRQVGGGSGGGVHGKVLTDGMVGDRGQHGQKRTRMAPATEIEQRHPRNDSTAGAMHRRPRDEMTFCLG